MFVCVCVCMFVCMCMCVAYTHFYGHVKNIIIIIHSWAEHNKLKGMSSDDARQLFCKVYGEARHFSERNFRKF